MNDHQTNGLKETLMRRLPPVLSSIVAQLPLDKTLLEIGRGQGLTIEHIGLLADATAEFIAGAVDTDGFLERLTMLAGGDKKRAARLAREVNEGVFAVIRNELKRRTEKRADAPETPPLQPPKPPPPPPSTRPSPPPAPQTVERKPEPLIIRPLPSQPREAIDSAQRIAGREPRTAIAPAPTPKPPLMEKPPSTAPPTSQPKPSLLPPWQKPPSAPPSPAVENRVAPVISPPGIQPAVEKSSQPGPGMPKPVPPSPASSYERVKEAVKQELASFQPPSLHGAIKMPEVNPIPSPMTDKEALRREIERFRAPSIAPTPPPPTALPSYGEPVKSAPQTPPAPKPLKLPQEKIPKPQAPEQYTTDPYKELPE